MSNLACDFNSKIFKRMFFEFKAAHLKGSNSMMTREKKKRETKEDAGTSKTKAHKQSRWMSSSREKMKKKMYF